MHDPYSETPETDDELVMTWMGKGEAFADKHAIACLVGMYVVAVAVIWCAGVLGVGAVPHLLVAMVHLIVSGAGCFALVIDGDEFSARLKLAILAFASSAVVMCVVEVLLP